MINVIDERGKYILQKLIWISALWKCSNKFGKCQSTQNYLIISMLYFSDPLHDMDCNIIHVWSLGAFWFFFPTECLLTTSRMRVLVNMVSTNRVPMKCWVTHILDVDKVAALLLAVSILTLDYQPQIFHKHILCPTSYFWIRTIGDQVTEINLDDTL